ncbi:ATPase [Vibrio satsumensis]|uniref:ATPase n=1 Tax=Vibrio TaxID=662 RepID=UPI0011B79FBF|nr:MULTISPECIES: ATPase [unclassified Vibrio]MDL5025834.1 ATPase [Vibrio sp. TMPB1044]MDN5205962.1 ATPase [Vibrio sp. TMPB1044]
MRANKVALTISMLFAISGCQSTPSEQTDANQNTNNNNESTIEVRSFQSVQSVYSEWEVKLEDHAQLSLYAPENYNELLDAWDDAESIYADLLKDETRITKSYSIFSSLTYAEAFDEKIALIKSNYDSILVLKKKADRVLADSIVQMDYLKFLGADTMFTSSYKRLYSEYSELFEYVLVDELEDAQEAQVEFLNNARLLEVKVAHKKYIEPLKNELEFLEDEDFDDVAPLTFAKATSQIALAESQVKASPREKSIIEDAVHAAEFELNHVRSVAHEVKVLASVKGDKFEQSVLNTENQLLSISQIVNDEDYRDVGLRQQSQKIVASVKALKNSDMTELLKSEIETLTEQLALLESENQKQAQQLSEATKHSEFLGEQITKSDAHIKSLEELVDSLKSLGGKVANESDSDVMPPTIESNLEDATLEQSSEGVIEPSV